VGYLCSMECATEKRKHDNLYNNNYGQDRRWHIWCNGTVGIVNGSSGERPLLLLLQ